MTTSTIIRRCIDRCARHVDGRWPWQAAAACQAALVKQGATPSIAAGTAAAAKRIGEWLRTRGNA